MTAAGVSAKFDGGSCDDVQRWISEDAPAGATGASGCLPGAAEGRGTISDPALEALAGGSPAGPAVDLAALAGATGATLRATDAVAASPPALTDNGSGTATLTVGRPAAGECPALSAADPDCEGRDA